MSDHAASGYDFLASMDHFLNYGYVFKTPTYFLMAEEGEIEGVGRCWFIWYLSHKGERLLDLLKLMPYELPYIAFCRHFRKNQSLRIYELDKLKKHGHA